MRIRFYQFRIGGFADQTSSSAECIQKRYIRMEDLEVRSAGNGVLHDYGRTFRKGIGCAEALTASGATVYSNIRLMEQCTAMVFYNIKLGNGLLYDSFSYLCNVWM